MIEGAATSGGAAERRVHALRQLARRWLGSPPVSGGLAAPPGGSAWARGVRGAYPELEFAHPLDGGPAAAVTRSVAGTAARSAVTRGSYRRLMQPLVAGGTAVTDLLLSAMRRPQGRYFPGLAVLARHRLRSAADRARRFGSPGCGRWLPAPPRTR